MARIAEVEAAWMAGLFDGEGCVYYRVQPRNGLLLIRCSMGMTDFSAMDKFASLLELEKISYQWGEQHTLKGKIVHVVQIPRFEMVEGFCDLLLPYSVVKKEDLEAALVAVKMIREAGPFPRGHRSEARSDVHRQAAVGLAQAIPPRYNRRS